MADKDWSLIVSLVGCVSTGAYILKVLLDQYLRKNSELESERKKNNDHFLSGLEKKLSGHAEQLRLNTVAIDGHELELKKAKADLTKFQAIVEELSKDLEGARLREARLTKIETDYQKINETYTFIKNRIQKPGG